MHSKTTLIGINGLFRKAFMILVLFVLTITIHAQTYVNGNLSTGATTKSGVAAPAGTTWSEVQNDAGVTTVSNTISGVASSVNANVTVSDDFTIPPGPSWDITKFTFYAYQTGAPATPTPFNTLHLQIHNSNPSAGATTILFGDLTTNRLSATNDALMYRCFNTTTPPPGTVQGTTRKIWTLEANVTLNLPPGTYWIEWQTGIPSTTATHFSPPSTVVDMRTVPGYNAQQHDLTANTWAPLEDQGNPATPPNVALDMPFKIDYTALGCFGTPAPGATLSTAVSACPGTPFTLSVANTTAGTGVTYQWQSATAVGGPYSPIAGATSANYVATQTVATWYQLVVTCSAGSSGTSTPVGVAIIAPPAITAQPADATICSGTNTSFSATATGASLTYQWQISTDGGGSYNPLLDGGIYSGATTNTLTLTNVPVGNNGYLYQLVVTVPGCSSVNSTSVTLTVNSAASFTTQPAAVTVCAGSDATFTTVAAGGTSLTYQWQVSTDGGTIFNPIAAANSATYTVPAVTSGMNNNLYNVIITNSCTPAGITSTNALLTVSNVASITAQPVDVTVCEGLNATFSVTASATSYQWQVSVGGGPFTDITGQTTTTLNLTGVTASMNSNQYRLVAFSCGPTGLNSTPATLTVNTGVSITTQPANVTACVGNSATFSITAAGTGPITYQWEASPDGTIWTPIPGANSNTATIPAVTLAMNGGFVHVIMTNGCTTSIISGSAQLTVEDLPSITAQPSSTSTCEGADASFSITATGTGLTYQWQVSTDGGANFTNIGGQTGSTLNLTAVAASDNNNQYQVRVFSNCSATGDLSAAATLTVNPLPVVTISAALYGNLTTQLTTTITASSTPASTTFSWYKDAALVSSVTGNTITVTHADLGVYTASVTDANGCTNTSNAVTIGDSTVSNAFIYPNPGNGVFNLLFSDGIDGISSARNIAAYDSKGSRVFIRQVVISSSIQKEVIDMSKLPKGVYSIEITNAAGERLRTEKVVID